MDTSIVNNIITSSVTVGVGIITAIAAYKGTIKGAEMQMKSQQDTALLQIQNEQDALNDNIEKQNRFNQKAIRNFISHEIKDNFMKLGDPKLVKLFNEYDSP
ncbi:hypothetical protein LXM61_30020, partial [Priestia megaterium]|uniref:hypothetical protein n=1 Tax=Priestia megaterium TaxID=1404 RepID=UPI001E60542C